MQQRQAWMREFLIERGHEPLPFVASRRNESSPAVIAAHIRDILQLREDWAAKQRTWMDALRLLRTAMDEAGILVVINGVVGNNTHRKLDPSEFRGFVLLDDYAPLVFVNAVDAMAAQMFTLAHVFVGGSTIFDLHEMLPADNRVEQLCNRVAAEFLENPRVS